MVSLELDSLDSLLRALMCVRNITADTMRAHLAERDGAGTRQRLVMQSILAAPELRIQCALDAAWSSAFGLPPTPSDVRRAYDAAAGAADPVAAVVRFAAEATFGRADTARVRELAMRATPAECRAAVVARWMARSGSARSGSAHVHDSMAAIHAATWPREDLPTGLSLSTANPLTGVLWSPDCCPESAHDSPRDSDGDMTPGELARAALCRDPVFVASQAACACLWVAGDAAAGEVDVLADALGAAWFCRVIVLLVGSSALRPADLSGAHDAYAVSDEIAANVPRRFRAACVLGSGSNPPPSPAPVGFLVGPWLAPAGQVRSLPAPYRRSARFLQSGAVAAQREWVAVQDLAPATGPVWLAGLAAVGARAFMDPHTSAGELAFHAYVARRAAALCGRPAAECSEERESGGSREQLRPKLSVVAIDGRRNPSTVFAVRNACSHLEPDRWALTVFCAPEAREYYSQALREVPGAAGLEVLDDLPDLRRARFCQEDYSRLLRSPALWRALCRYDRVLLVQDDGTLLRPGLEASGLLEWDYVGAPWADVPYNAPLKAATAGRLTGNGGLSLRSPAAMLAVAERVRPRIFHDRRQAEPEDAYFAAGVVRTGGRLCPAALAAGFSSEEVLTAGSLGFHKPWAYHGGDEVVRFFRDAP